jgi:hypothetical protein
MISSASSSDIGFQGTLSQRIRVCARRLRPDDQLSSDPRFSKVHQGRIARPGALRRSRLDSARHRREASEPPPKPTATTTGRASSLELPTSPRFRLRCRRVRDGPQGGTYDEGVPSRKGGRRQDPSSPPCQRRVVVGGWSLQVGLIEVGGVEAKLVAAHPATPLFPSRLGGDVRRQGRSRRSRQVRRNERGAKASTFTATRFRSGSGDGDGRGDRPDVVITAGEAWLLLFVQSGGFALHGLRLFHAILRGRCCTRTRADS